VGFGISLFTAVLGPQQPQARNVELATATAIAATTHGLATHLHHLKEYAGWFIVSMPTIIAKNRYIPTKVWMHMQGTALLTELARDLVKIGPAVP
jgi:hypothetical protein